jgi:hypothetical protein
MSQIRLSVTENVLSDPDRITNEMYEDFLEKAGLAKSLLKYAVDWLFETGHDRVCLTTGANTRADRFYAAQGWRRQPISATEIGYSLTKSSVVAQVHPD